jgi:type I restriction enzyme R subunit
VIDEFTTDEVLGAGFDLKAAARKVESFRKFIEEHKNELLALQILYNQPYGRQRLTYAAIRELTQKLTDPPYFLDVASVWQAFKRLDASKVRGAPVDQQLTEIISLVRYALCMDELLEPFGAKVEQRFNLWVGRQKRAGKEFSEPQMLWLRAIAQFIGANAEITKEDFMTIPVFADKGGLIIARQLFEPGMQELMDELQMALVG